MNNLKKFLEFNEKKVYFITANGVWHIAIKPICEALGVNYNRQFQNIKEDDILGPAFATQQMQVPGDQARGWACLPEFFIYGWLMSIQSESKELKAYKWKCYELLYNYFHGALTERTKMLKVKTQLEVELEKKKAELANLPKVPLAVELEVEIEALEDKIKKENKSLRKSDEDIVTSQFEPWQSEKPPLSVETTAD